MKRKNDSFSKPGNVPTSLDYGWNILYTVFLTKILYLLIVLLRIQLITKHVIISFDPFINYNFIFILHP